MTDIKDYDDHERLRSLSLPELALDDSPEAIAEWDRRGRREPTTDEKLDELLALLRPLGPALEKLPEMVEQVGPLIEAAKKSPVLRMLGISL